MWGWRCGRKGQALKISSSLRLHVRMVQSFSRGCRIPDPTYIFLRGPGAAEGSGDASKSMLQDVRRWVWWAGQVRVSIVSGFILITSCIISGEEVTPGDTVALNQILHALYCGQAANGLLHTIRAWRVWLLIIRSVGELSDVSWVG